MSSRSRGSHRAHGRGSRHDSHGPDGGPLVKVGFARTQAEAEMMQGLLLDAGMPSVLKRTRGFDNPDFLVAGPHDIMVGSDFAAKARALLSETMLESEEEERDELNGALRRAAHPSEASASRLAIWIGLAFVAAVLIVWFLYQLS